MGWTMIPSVRGTADMQESKCVLSAEVGIEYGGFEPWCADVFLSRTKRRIGGDNIIFLNQNREIPTEGYEIRIEEHRIELAASTEHGVIWALTSLAVLLVNDGNGAAIPCGVITDAPRYRHRGLLLDCARHFFPAEEVKKVIEEISLAKMNVLHWHLTDDQGWRIESKRFPNLHEKSGDYYTQEEIADVCEYARIRGVEVIPEIDMPGHVSSLLAAYPQYSCSGRKVQLAKGGGIFPVILCAGRDEVFDFLDELLGEIAPLFPGSRMHIGGDEAPKNEWKKCPDCRARMKALGLTEWEDLQGYFMTRASEILAKYGKEAICWNETLRAANHPKKMQTQYWTLQHRDTMAGFAAEGGAWIYSDMFELYLDYPYSMTSVKKVYETVPHLGEENVADQPNLLGMEGCLWTEHVTEATRLENLLFPRIYALAEIAWSGNGNYEQFAARLCKFTSSKLHQGISYTEESWWVPTGAERQKEAFGYLASIHSGMSDEVKDQTVESTAPNEEFGRAFMTKFFQPEDMAILMGGADEGK